MKSDQQTARHSALVKPSEGACLNVMDAAAHALQAQHRNRYVGVSIAPMFERYIPSLGNLFIQRQFNKVKTRAY